MSTTGNFSEENVEQWLIDNPFAARRIMRRNDFEAAASSRMSLNSPGDFYYQFFSVAQKVNSCLDVNVIVDYVLQTAVKLVSAQKCSVFLLDKESQELYTIAFDINSETPKYFSPVENVPRVHIRVKVGQGIVGTVAKEVQGRNIKDAYQEPLFNRAVDRETGFRTKSILCLPIFEPGTEGETNLIGVANLINKVEIDEDTGAEFISYFTDRDEEMFKNLLALVGIALRNARLYENTIITLNENIELCAIADKESKRAKFLLELAKQIGKESNTQQLVISILQFAKKITSADLTSLFLVDHEKQELFSKLFVGEKEKIITIPMHGSIAGSVALSGETANIPDAYKHPKFNPQVDKDNNYLTKSVLCVPIFGNDKQILGVANLINKIDPETNEVTEFTREDQENFETFAIFYGIALGKAMMMEKMSYEKQRMDIVMELMCFHSQTRPEEVTGYSERETLLFDEPDVVKNWFYNAHQFNNTDEKLTAISHQLFLITNFQDTFRIPNGKMIEYIMTVRKNYRPVAYHNFTHAVSVTHSVFLFIVNGLLDEYFDTLEQFSMLVAALNHDIDHRGTNNSFQKQTGSVLANFYASSTMERHHFNHAMTILNSSEKLNILDALPTADYKRCLGLIEASILATDLNLFFEKKKKLDPILDAGAFDKTNREHLDLFRCIVMTCSDLGAMFKHFDQAIKTANEVYSEFFTQGDEEVKMGLPFSSELTDRRNKEKIPKMQVGFYNFVVLPAFKTLHKIIKDPINHVMDSVNENLNQWKILQDNGKEYTFDEPSFPSKFNVPRSRSKTETAISDTLHQRHAKVDISFRLGSTIMVPEDPDPLVDQLAEEFMKASVTHRENSHSGENTPIKRKSMTSRTNLFRAPVSKQ